MNHHSYKNGIRDKGIISLRYHGFTYKEIGNLFGISVERIRQIIFRYYKKRGYYI